MTKWRVLVGVALVVAVGVWVGALWVLSSPQDLLVEWVLGCLAVGAVLAVGGARAPGAALVGSSIGAFVSLFTPFHSGHLETLVHGAVILGSVGLVGFGFAGLALGAHAPLGRYPEALALAVGTVVVGALLVLRIHAEAAPPCSLITGLRVTNTSPSVASCFRGFEDPWLQALLGFNVAFLALLFLVQAWKASRSSGEDPFVDWVMGGKNSRTAPF
jgi:hypothetical protein